jgi:adenylate cyclase
MAAFQKSRQQFMVGAVIAAGITVIVVLLLARTSGFRRLENITYDQRMVRTAKPSEADKRIVIIDVDNPSFEALKGNFGRWPWSRIAWTNVLYYVNTGKPRAVFFDITFSGAESPQVDEPFAQQIQWGKHVVLGYTFADAAGMDETDPSVWQAKLKLLERDSYKLEAGTLAHPLEGNPAINAPLPELAHAAVGLGVLNATIDADGVLRRMPLALSFANRGFPTLSARTADEVMNHAKPPQPFTRDGRYATHDGWRIPVDNDGNLVLLWHGDSFVYERIPIWNVFCSNQPEQCDAQTKKYPASYFRDKIVLIGASAIGSYEVRATPFSGTAPGFIYQATAVDNLIHHEGMRVAPTWFSTAGVIVFAVLGAAILVVIASTVWGSALLLLVLGGYTWAAYWSFGHEHLWLPFVAPAFSLVVSFVATGTVRFATTGRELRQTRGTLNRYMAPQLVEYVLNNVDNLNFAGEKRELTIFFSDVRNFTTLTEKSDPMVLISMLNEYLEAMTSTIFKHDGIVDKFIGDGILAYWGAFTPGNHAYQAAEASLEMFGRLKELNTMWKEKGWPEIDIGVGLNTGEVILGNVGAGKKIEFTVIGDPVNLASRLESLNKEYKCHIIISEFTLARLGDAATVRSLGGVKVKGKTIETAIYELQGLRAASAAAAKN